MNYFVRGRMRTDLVEGEKERKEKSKRKCLTEKSLPSCESAIKGKVAGSAQGNP